MKTGFFSLGEADREALTAHFLRLSREDRRLRFSVSMTDEALRQWSSQVPLSATRGFFHFGELVAVVFIAPETRSRFEFAISIDEAFRGTGLGSLLLDMAVEATAAKQLVIRHAPENNAMARVYRHYPTRRSLEDGEMDVRIDLDSVREEELQARSLVCAAVGD